MIALVISTAFLLGPTGLAVAQTTASAPSQEKKSASKAMTTEEKKAVCLEKAGSDGAKKAACEKKSAAKAKQKAMRGKTEEKK